MAEQSATHGRQKELGLVNKLLAEVETEASNLAVSLALATSGGAMNNAILSRMQTVDKNHAELKARRDELVSSLASDTLSNEDINLLLQYGQDVMTGLEHATFQDKRRVLQTLRVKATIVDEEATVECRIRKPQTIAIHSVRESSPNAKIPPW